MASTTADISHDCAWTPNSLGGRTARAESCVALITVPPLRCMTVSGEILLIPGCCGGRSRRGCGWRCSRTVATSGLPWGRCSAPWTSSRCASTTRCALCMHALLI